MLRLARDLTGTPLVGDADGFVPATSIDAALADQDVLLEWAANGALSLDDVPQDRTPAEAISFGLPLAAPGKLWGIGLNYADHAADLDEERPSEPASFMKPPTTLRGPGGPIPLPPPDQTQHVTAEAEIGVVIGRDCAGVDPTAVSAVIAGYVPLIDMTAEDVLRRNPRFLTRAKSYDGFLVLGPWVSVPEGPIRADTEVRTIVNGAIHASNTCDRMLFGPEELVSFHSSVMSLQAGDLIMTGTPGAHQIEDGDTARAEVDRIGAVSAEVVGPNGSGDG